MNVEIACWVDYGARAWSAFAKCENGDGRRLTRSDRIDSVQEPSAHASLWEGLFR
jgi:hypothetical protein